MAAQRTRELPNDLTGQLQGMYRAIETFREHDREATLILLQIFLTIATAEDHTLTMADVSKRLEVAQASMSYNIARLGAVSQERLRARVGADRLNLVEMRQDLLDKRRFTLGLTRQGRNLASAIAAALPARF